MRSARASRAFTLIEAMAVVLIVGILATLATVAYRKWITTARIGEAQDMIAQIRAAEEAYRAENGSYLSVSKGLDPTGAPSGRILYPSGTPGAFKTGWGAACSSTACNNSNSWNWLGVAPANPVWFGYAVYAGSSSTTAPSVTVNGTTVNVASSTSGQPWYVAQAMGDTNGNGIWCTLYGFSNTNQIMIDHEGE